MRRLSSLMMAGTLALGLVVTLSAAAEARPHHRGYHHHHRHGHYKAHRGRFHYNRVHDQGQLVAHPSGCPRTLFCGCGVSVKVFGRPIRDLFLASNYRKFPSASPAAGMVAWRPGHAFYIEQYLGNGVALAYDPNSGHHQTRIHQRSLAGYHVVNPHAGHYASL